MNVEELQLAIATGQFRVVCPQRTCGSVRFYVPDNGIGLVCERCGAWSRINPEAVGDVVAGAEN